MPRGNCDHGSVRYTIAKDKNHPGVVKTRWFIV